MDQSRLAEMTMDLICVALAGETDRAAATLQDIGMQTTHHEMYGVCCAIATAGVQALRKVYGAQYDPSGGDLMVFEELTPGAMAEDPPKAWAMRFLVAYANDDTPSTLALFETALKASDEEYVSSVAALLVNVTGLLRLSLDEA